jgi:hypothetical protein
MAGTVLRVMPKRTLDFTSVSSGMTEEIVVAQGIDISQWREVSLMVRTHANTIPGTGMGYIYINAYLEGRTSEDPGILFAAATPVNSVTISGSTVAPAYSVVPCTNSPAGSMMKITAMGSRPSSSSNLLRADISVDLSLKSS